MLESGRACGLTMHLKDLQRSAGAGSGGKRLVCVCVCVCLCVCVSLCACACALVHILQHIAKAPCVIYPNTSA